MSEIKSQNTTKALLSERPGRVNELTISANGFEGTSQNANFRISVYKNGIIRVQWTRGDFDTHSYAVVSEPEAARVDIQDNDREIILTTPLIKLVFQKEDSSITFLTTSGEIVNQDEPGLGVSWIGEQVTTYKHIQKNERFVGLGEKTGPLDRRGHGYEHWNTDSFAYGPDTDPIYSTIPFYIGIHHKVAYGIFFDNTHKSFFNFGASNNRFSSFSADSGEMNYYFINYSTVPEIISSYTWLTGRMPLPPIWSIGYQQCRYSYYPDTEVLNIADTFRTKDIPADAIVLDIHYMDEFKIFTWDKQRFSNPGKMIDQLKKQGFHVVVMCDPGIKVEKGYAPYDDGIEKDVFVKYPDGSYYEGEVWPGWCHFPDFTDPVTRSWWADYFNSYTSIGVDGFWNDMNEFATWGQMLPELLEFDFDGQKATTRKARNIYGLSMARSTYEATRKLLNKRPFNLTRSGYAGIQRYAAIWTGDNVANDEHMMLGIRLVNSMGLAGIAFAGYDVGGFVGNASEHLFARWVQAGAFSPFFRGHSMINSRDSEPWAYGEEVEEVSRNYIKLRYKLIMYLYSAFYEASLTGLPVARSLVLEFPFDDKIYKTDYQHQYLFGDCILVAPHESYKEIVKVYLPEGEWYDLFTDQILPGNKEIFVETSLNKIPLYVKASAIFPVCSNAGSHTGDLGNVIEWHVYHGKETTEFQYYEDDGISYDYRENNFFKRKIIFEGSKKQILFSAPEGDFTSKFSVIRLCLHGFGQERILINDKQIKLQKQSYRFVEPVSNFDPMYTDIDDSLTIEEVHMADLPSNSEQLKITWD